MEKDKEKDWDIGSCTRFCYNAILYFGIANIAGERFILCVLDREDMVVPKPTSINVSCNSQGIIK